MSRNKRPPLRSSPRRVQGSRPPRSSAKYRDQRDSSCKKNRRSGKWSSSKHRRSRSKSRSASRSPPRRRQWTSSRSRSRSPVRPREKERLSALKKDQAARVVERNKKRKSQREVEQRRQEEVQAAKSVKGDPFMRMVLKTQQQQQRQERQARQREQGLAKKRKVADGTPPPTPEPKDGANFNNVSKEKAKEQEWQEVKGYLFAHFFS